MERVTQEKTAIVTGGNSGLGYRVAEATATLGRGWRVVVAGRNEQKVAGAVRAMISGTGNENIEGTALDLGSMKSVRRFVEGFAARDDLPPLRAVVCGAATQIVSGTRYTEDGFEATFGVNHLGHFLLVNLLLGHLAPPARILFVGSGTHDPGQFANRAMNMSSPRYADALTLAYPEEDGEAKPSEVGTGRYATSKLCNILFTYELDLRLKEAGVSTSEAPITVNAFDPGLMPGTGLARDYNSVAWFIWRYVMPALTFLPTVNRPKRSGEELARLVLDPQLKNVSGKYFVGRESVPSSKESYDRRKWKELWQTSAELVNLSSNESVLPTETSGSTNR